MRLREERLISGLCARESGVEGGLSYLEVCRGLVEGRLGVSECRLGCHSGRGSGDMGGSSRLDSMYGSSKYACSGKLPWGYCGRWEYGHYVLSLNLLAPLGTDSLSLRGPTLWCPGG